jgi:hypothetical protein
MIGFAIGDIFLLKLALIITKTKKRRKMKSVMYSFLIQFGVVFLIGSPLFILSLIGQFDGDPGVITAISVLGLLIDINIINVIHNIGLKRSLVVGLLVIVPMILVMSFMGNMLSSFIRPTF